MPATRDGKTWRSQFYYEDWQGIFETYREEGDDNLLEALAQCYLKNRM